MAEPSDCVTSDSASASGSSSSRLSEEGYGLEVPGYQHRISNPQQAIVFLDNDTSYKIRLSNANSHLCMVTVELDKFVIGKCCTCIYHTTRPSLPISAR